MRRRRALAMVGLLLVIFGGMGGTMLWLVKREPDFFEAVRVSDEVERKQLSTEFERRFFNFIPSIFVNHEPEWSESFTAAQINSYLEMDGGRWSMMESIMRHGASSPRVSLEDGVIRLGLRYGKGWLSTIVTIDLKVWLPAVDQNVIAVELLGMHAGALPIGTVNLIERLTELVRPLPIDVTWYRHQGHPVAIIQLQLDQSRPTLLLDRLVVLPGRIEIAGRTRDQLQFHALKSAPGD